MIFQPNFIFKEILGYHPAAENERISKVSRKTWNSWDQKGNIPDNKTSRKAKRNYDTYFNQIVKDFSGETDQANFTGIIDQFDDYSRGNSLSRRSTWKFLFDNPLERISKTNIWQYFPQTKNLILLLEEKEIQTCSLLKKEYFEEATDLICNIKLPGLHFTDENIISYLKTAKTASDFMRKRMLFSLRANLYCLASFDAEDAICINQDASQMNCLLPQLENGKIYPPIFWWFEALRKITGLNESWGKLCLSDAFENYNKDNYLDQRLLRKWRYGEQVPKPKTIHKILTCLFPSDRYPKDDFIRLYMSWYFASILQHLYMLLDELVHGQEPVFIAEKKDIAEFFEEYNSYFTSLSDEYKKLAAV